jgi:excisionase family DNA binding protein
MNPLLTEKEAAEKLGMSVAALRRWRLEMRGPTFIRVGTRIRYREEDLESYVESNAQRTGDVSRRIRSLVR